MLRLWWTNIHNGVCRVVLDNLTSKYLLSLSTSFDQVRSLSLSSIELFLSCFSSDPHFNQLKFNLTISSVVWTILLLTKLLCSRWKSNVDLSSKLKLVINFKHKYKNMVMLWRDLIRTRLCLFISVKFKSVDY